jgi:hypothetical protein
MSDALDAWLRGLIEELRHVSLREEIDARAVFATPTDNPALGLDLWDLSR